MAAVIRRPWQSQQVALPLASPERQDECQFDFRRRDREQSGYFGFTPEFVGAIGGVQATTFFAGISCDRPTIFVRPSSSSWLRWPRNANLNE
jgi:hypothetical protein